MTPTNGLRESYLPLRKRDLIELCANDPRLPPADRPAFRDLCRILESVFHFEYHAELERLKDCHAPFDPDSDELSLAEPTADQLDAARRGLIDGFERLLRAANYEPVARETLQASLRGESLFKVRLAIDFDDFEDMLLYRRDRSEREETIRTWFGLKKKTIRFLNFGRIALFVRFKPEEHFEKKRRADLPFLPGSTVIKLFRNVPADDLEMVFPNTAVRMKLIDKLLIGVPAAVGGLIVVATKLLSTLLLTGSVIAFWLGIRDEPAELDQTALLALAIGLGTLAAFVWRQINRFKTRKIRFLKALTENLYFKNLDNNAGVLHRLVDDAEEEECKEAILAYWWLLTAGQPLTAEQVDRDVETFLRDRTGLDIDFEIRDAVAKIERLGLATRDGERLTALSLADAKAVLDRTWDGYFEYGQAPANRIAK